MSGPQTPQPRSGQRVGIVEGWELRRARQRDANSGAWKGLVFVVVLLIGLVIGGWIVARPVIGPAVTGLFEQNPEILHMPIVADLLRAELGDRLDAPASSQQNDVEFVVDAGQTVDQYQENLVDAGLLTDTLAFRYLVMSDRVDQLIGAGTYTMNTGMSPHEVVGRLAADPDPPTPVVNLALRPGLRIEQIAAYLQAQTEETELSLDPKEFLDLATNPRPELFDEFPFLRQVSEGNSLEGFLAGGLYPVPIDINADEFLHLLLQEWEDDSGDLVAQARKKGIDFYDALTVASLVEREVKVDSDRARVAGVYWNRLDPRSMGPRAGSCRPIRRSSTPRTAWHSTSWPWASGPGTSSGTPLAWPTWRR